MDCFNTLGIKDKAERCFLSKKKVVYSIQRINVLLKEIKERYNLKIEHFSTHSFRKTFGRRVVEQAGDNSEMALIKLSELFNHSTPQITRRYLGLRQEELLEVYDSLTF
jgi:integrase